VPRRKGTTRLRPPYSSVGFTITMLINTLALLALLVSIYLVSGQFDGRVEFEFTRTPHDCGHECVNGACSFKGCNSRTGLARCPGGACSFEGCEDAECSGGTCEFTECTGGSCDGGSCSFRKHRNTLKKGYCSGDSCTLDGEEWPTFVSHLTI
jgi:hypothetical protein